ncbi:MAG: DNA topoisomerase IV subunit A [Acidobacteriota bacterium]
MSSRKSGDNGEVVRRIKASSDGIYRKILARKKPSMQFPVRSLANVRYHPSKGYLEMAGLKKERTLSVSTVKNFAQTLRMIALSKSLIEMDTFATKRDAYYQTKNWEEARCDEQDESDTIMDDIEAYFALNKEQLGFRPDEHGGSVAGELIVVDHEPGTTRRIEIDCTRFGSGSYAIPSAVEHLEFKTKADFVLAIETSGMFERLNYHKFWKTAKCILVSMNGVPTRAVRRFIRRLADSRKIPVYVFVDCDPYGIGNIYRTLKVGSGNNAHLNRFFCVPQARFLGVTPQDITDYKLPTHPLKDVDVKRARDALKNDPFFRHHKSWQHAIELLMKMGVRAEQQALAKHGLNYVIDEYLPKKLKRTDQFLP